MPKHRVDHEAAIERLDKLNRKRSLTDKESEKLSWHMKRAREIITERRYRAERPDYSRKYTAQWRIDNPEKEKAYRDKQRPIRKARDKKAREKVALERKQSACRITPVALPRVRDRSRPEAGGQLTV